MQQPNNSSRRVIVALIAGMLIYSLGMGTTYPLLGVLLSGETSAFLNGLNASATGIGLLLGVIIVSWVSRRAGAGKTVMIGVAMMAGSLAIMVITRDFWLLFAARVLLGCGANLMFVVAETALNTFAAPARRGRVMGIYAAAVALGYVVGPAGVALAHDTPETLLSLCALVTLAALLPMRLAREQVDRFVKPAAPGSLLPTMIAAPFALAFVLIAAAVDAVAISLLPVVALDQGFSVGQAALLVTFFHLGLLIGQPVIGIALDSLGRRRTVLLCCLVSCLCAGTMVFGEGMAFWVVTLVLFAFGGANYGLYTAGLALIGDRFEGEALSAATTAIAGVYAVASVSAPLLAGSALDGMGAGGLYGAAAVLYFVALCLGAIRFRPLEPTLCAQR